MTSILANGQAAGTIGMVVPIYDIIKGKKERAGE